MGIQTYGLYPLVQKRGYICPTCPLGSDTSGFDTSLIFTSPPVGMWSDGVVVRALDLRLRGSQVRLPASRFQVTTLGKLFTHMRLCHQTV